MNMPRTESGNPDPALEDFEKIVDAFRERLERYQRIGSELVDLAVGPLVGGVVGSVVGLKEAIVAMGLSELVKGHVVPDNIKKKAGAALFEPTSPDQHMVVTTLDRLSDMARGRR